MILMFVRNWLDWIQGLFHWGVLKLKDTLTKVAVAIVVLIILLWLSIFLYGIFYFAYIPPATYIKPINLEFSVCEKGYGICSLPTANVSLLREGHDEVLDAFSNDQICVKSSVSVFMKGQAYRILFDIEIPESQTNKDLGMFMVTLQLYNHKGGTVQSSARSAILHYRSELLRIMDTFVFAPLLLSGYSEQKQFISTEFFSQYWDDVYNPAVGAVIQVQSMKIEMYSSVLKIYATFSGIRYFMFHWPVLSSIVGIGMNFSFLSLIALLSWYQCIWSNHKEGDDVHCIGENSPNLEERRRNVRQMLDRERQREAELIDSTSGPSSGAQRYPPDDIQTETVGGSNVVLDDDDGEETVLYKSMPECDTELRLRHHSNTAKAAT